VYRHGCWSKVEVADITNCINLLRDDDCDDDDDDTLYQRLSLMQLQNEDTDSIGL